MIFDQAEPCGACAQTPTMNWGHGTFLCEGCYDRVWCITCGYQTSNGHVCPTPEERAEHEQAANEFLAMLEAEERR